MVEEGDAIVSNQESLLRGKINEGRWKSSKHNLFSISQRCFSKEFWNAI